MARLDAWLWSVRLFKTRSAATAACRGGHVRVNDAPAKAAQPVATGDTVRVRRSGDEPLVTGNPPPTIGPHSPRGQCRRV